MRARSSARRPASHSCRRRAAVFGEPQVWQYPQPGGFWRPQCGQNVPGPRLDAPNSVGRVDPTPQTPQNPSESVALWHLEQSILTPFLSFSVVHRPTDKRPAGDRRTNSAPTMVRVSPRVNRRKIRLLLFGNYVSVRPFGFMIDGIVVRLNLSQKFFAFGGLQRRF